MLTVERDVSGEQILQAIRELRERSSEHTRQLAKSARLAPPELACLRAVRELTPGGECTVAHVAARGVLTLPTASRVLGQLVDAGFLVREYGRIDRRKVFLTLTPLGEERLEQSACGAQARVVDRLQALSASERADAYATLTRLTELISERSDA